MPVSQCRRALTTAPRDQRQKPFMAMVRQSFLQSPSLPFLGDMHPRKVKASTGHASKGLIKDLEEEEEEAEEEEDLVSIC